MAEASTTPMAAELVFGAEHTALSPSVAAHPAEAASPASAEAATVPMMTLAADVVKTAHTPAVALAAAVALATAGAVADAAGAQAAPRGLASPSIPRAALAAFVVVEKNLVKLLCWHLAALDSAAAAAEAVPGSLASLPIPWAALAAFVAAEGKLRQCLHPALLTSAVAAAVDSCGYCWMLLVVGAGCSYWLSLLELLGVEQMWAHGPGNQDCLQR
mmetsp:Transcript_55028/g.109391  ORF Transcript_55028/g.109391 Transcript_55028/m.109391 type:complete len:216 (-) Transcript_55028:334-981(-)